MLLRSCAEFTGGTVKISRLLQFLGGTAIAGICLYIFFRGVDMQELGRELVQSSPLSLFLAGVLMAISLWLRGIRWALILPDMPGAQKKDLFSFTSIGFMANNILPARMGEAARALFLWKKNQYPPVIAIGSLILERGFDVLVFASFFFVPVLALDNLGTLRYPAWFLVVVYSFCIACLTLYACIPKRIESGARKCLFIVPGVFRGRLAKIGTELASNLSWIFSAKKVVAMILLSYTTIVCFAFAMMLIMGPTTGFTFLHTMLAQAFASIGAAIPLAPGYIGTLHASLYQGFLYCGLSEEKARAAAILYHATTYISITATGLFFFFRTDIRFKDISDAKSRLEK
ncbi:MAG: flippase-like domain-containing protein [Chitinivibrionales bacterium]|nr:flippase-like domain-containing protein [Chitinivibrionales bacterium]